MVNQYGDKCWTMSSEHYCDTAVVNVEEVLIKKGVQLPAEKCTTPMRSGYKPGLDVTAELKADGVTWYKELIGKLRWTIEIGRVILLEVLLLFQHFALPRDGHLEQALYIMGYLRMHKKLRLMFDKGTPTFDN